MCICNISLWCNQTVRRMNSSYNVPFLDEFSFLWFCCMYIFDMDDFISWLIWFGLICKIWKFMNSAASLISLRQSTLCLYWFYISARIFDDLFFEKKNFLHLILQMLNYRIHAASFMPSNWMMNKKLQVSCPSWSDRWTVCVCDPQKDQIKCREGYLHICRQCPSTYRFIFVEAYSCILFFGGFHADFEKLLGLAFILIQNGIYLLQRSLMKTI